MAIDNDAPKTPKLAQRIEPGVGRNEGDIGLYQSIAISSKRNADALERIADALETIAAQSSEAAYDAMHGPIGG